MREPGDLSADGRPAPAQGVGLTVGATGAALLGLGWLVAGLAKLADGSPAALVLIVGAVVAFGGSGYMVRRYLQLVRARQARQSQGPRDLPAGPAGAP